MRNARIPKLLILLLLMLVLGLPGVLAKPAESNAEFVVKDLTPAARQQRLDQTIAKFLSQHHYRRSKLDDQLSARILTNYFDDLDFSRSYFLAGDLARFEQYRHALDDALRRGDLQPAYDIFNVYLRRLAERTQRIQTLLEQGFSFDLDESLEVDRKDAPWAKNAAELDEIWRKRLKHEMLTLMLSGKDQAGARELLRKRYDNRLRQALQSSSDDVFQLYMNAVAQAFDPHTAYFSPRNTENFNIQMRLSLEGIGAVLRMEEEQVTVVELVAGGPADLSQQIRAGDRIVAVAQGDDDAWVDVVGWRLDDVVERIRGPRGTVVRLKVLPGKIGAAAAEKAVRLVRDTIQLEKQAAKSEIRTLPGPDNRALRIGVITIPTFYSDFEAARRVADYRSTTRDVRQLLETLRGEVDGLVLDLRDNGGGSLQEAVDLTGLFIGGGPVVQVRNAGGKVDIEEDGDSARVYDGPLAVLVNHASASASEIFAGAVQDYGRGLVIGDPTFGKGTVQTLVDLNRFTRTQEPQGQLKLTFAKFYRISGGSTQHRGVQPDIHVPSSVMDSDEVGESAQKNALPWDEIASARYRGDQQLAALVPELRQRHQARTKKDPDYQSFLQDLEFTRQQRNKTTLSLMESQRRAEREYLENWRRERENRYRVAKGLPPLKPGDPIPEGEESAVPDATLEESSRIVADLILLSDPNETRRSLVLGR
ncbi:MAG: carboxy terminal-processing peptidase [Candidatus Competibacteraceae bacterium]|nr:carboxy terminal-processing peptidase [Candidatus Competibacteraceae bacterium]